MVLADLFVAFSFGTQRKTVLYTPTAGFVFRAVASFFFGPDSAARACAGFISQNLSATHNSWNVSSVSCKDGICRRVTSAAVFFFFASDFLYA